MLPLLGYGVLRSTRVQTHLGQRIAAYFSRQLETKVSVGGVDVTFFLKLVLEDVLIEDRNEEPMVSAKRMVLDISRLSFRKRTLTINRLSLDQASLSLSRCNGEEDYNFRFFIDYFSEEQPQTDKQRWGVICKSLEFSNSAFALNDHNKPTQDFAFDPAHIAIEGFTLVMNDILLLKDTLSFELDRLAFSETKGFYLQYLSGSFLVNPTEALIQNLIIKTPASDLKLQAQFEYDGYEAFDHFFEEVKLVIDFEKSRLELSDASFFIPAAYGLEGPVDLSGNFRGTPANLRGSELSLNYGRNTVVKGNFHSLGLPYINETFINLSLEELRTSYTDLSNFKLPNNARSNFLQVPANLTNLGRVSFSGRLTGFINDMVAFGSLRTDIGSISSDILVRQPEHSSLPYYKGSISTKDFDLGKFFENEDQFGKLSLNAEVEGTGITLETVNMDITGLIETIDLANYNYENIDIAGNVSNNKFNGSLLVDDQNLFLDFQGVVDFGNEPPVFNFSARFEQANLTQLNVFQRDSLAHNVVSGLLNINASASSLDDLVGIITLDNLIYEEKPIDGGEPFAFTTGKIELVNTLDENNHKNLSLRSEFIDADLQGQFFFGRWSHSVRSLVESYIPAFYTNIPLNGSSGEYPLKHTVFDIRIKDTEILSDLFLPFIRFSPGSHIKGDFGEDFGQLNVFGHANEFVLAGNRFDNWTLKGEKQQQAYHFDVVSDRTFLTDSIFVDRLRLASVIRHDSVFIAIDWSNQDISRQNFANIESYGRFFNRKQSEWRFLPSFAMVNDSLWQIDTSAHICIDSSFVKVENFKIFRNQEYVLANGTLSPRPEDHLYVEFNDFDIYYLAELLKVDELNFDGILNGALSFGGIRSSLRLEADLEVRDFAFNFDHLGDLQFKSKWDNEKKGFNFDLQVVYYGNVGSNKPLQARGYFYPDRKQDNFDLDIFAENLKMSIWSRYLESFASNFRGMATGRLRLEGPTKKPELSGKVRLARSGFRIDFLNTGYTFSDELVIGKDFLAFENVVINDTLGNSGLVSGKIYHQLFKDFSLDIMIRPERMALLNTTKISDGVYFYGRAFGTGQAHIHGPVEDIVMDINGRTNRGTQIFLPLDYTEAISETSFITFVSRDTTINTVPLSISPTTNLTLNFDLEVTPDAEIQLIFDSQIGDIIRGRGSGNIKMEIPASGGFYMFGDYTIEEGDYLFTLQNIINKRFRIEQGGTIRWTGDPLDADIDLRAVYRLRTALHDLVMDADMSEAFHRRVPVETILILKDKLMNPSINFDIVIPGGDESTRELLERIITTEQEMNRQVFSLLVLNRFMPTTIDQYNTALGYGVGSTSSELLSNQLSNWLSQISSDFDIGINYRPGDEISSQKVEVALSTQLFNDRVIIDGNVGVAGQNPALSNQRTSSIIGDVNVEVKITPEGKFRVKAFNRSNTFDILNTTSPYTQGIGVFYRKEFDSLSELWRRRWRAETEPGYQEDTIPVEL